MTKIKKLKPKPAIKSLDPKILHEIHADEPHDYKGNPLVIGIDGNEANVEKKVGSNMAAFKILENLYQMAHDPALSTEDLWKIRKDHRYVVYLKDKPRDDMPKESEKWKYKVIPMKRIWTQTRLPWELYFGGEKLDIFYSPGHYSPRWCPCPLVVTILDTAYLNFPDYFKQNDLFQLKKWTKRSIERADHLIAISGSTKQDVLENYEVEAFQVSVVHMGIDHERFFFPQTDKEINRVKSKYNIPGDYILYLGTLQPRKNLIRLVEAFKIAMEKRKGKKPKDKSISFTPPPPPLGKGGQWGVYLVIAGKKGWMYEEIFEKVRELGIEKQVLFTDYVPDEDVPGLMAGARCLALVALYEGFGIPVIESLAVGTPAVASGVSSLPEALGNAGIKVDPEQVEDIAEGLGQILDMNDKDYYALSEKGIEHAGLFCWKKTGRKVLEVLENVGGLPV